MQPSLHHKGVHFAKNVFTNQYKNRPNNSFRIKIAKNRFPKIKAPGYLIGYFQWPEAARTIPTALRETTKVKNFLDYDVLSTIYFMIPASLYNIPVGVEPDFPKDPL